MSELKQVFTLLATLLGLLIPFSVYSHPGSLDVKGGHYCWTNCSIYDYSYGEYHFHDTNSTPVCDPHVWPYKDIYEQDVASLKSLRQEMDGSRQECLLDIFNFYNECIQRAEDSYRQDINRYCDSSRNVGTSLSEWCNLYQGYYNTLVNGCKSDKSSLDLQCTTTYDSIINRFDYCLANTSFIEIPVDPIVNNDDPVTNANSQEAYITNYGLAGELVKVAGNPAVYLTQAGKRYAFPNEKIYKSWYGEIFSDVKTVSLSYLSGFQLSANVTFKPGSLIKIPSIPRVYLVTDGATLRWIKTEEKFKEFGYSFDQVNDLSESLFVDYSEGLPIE